MPGSIYIIHGGILFAHPLLSLPSFVTVGFTLTSGIIYVIVDAIYEDQVVKNWDGSQEGGFGGPRARHCGGSVAGAFVRGIKGPWFVSGATLRAVASSG